MVLYVFIYKGDWYSVVIQSPNHVRLFETPRTASCEASLSLTTSWSLPKFMSIASVMQLGEGMANNPSILAVRTSSTVLKKSGILHIHNIKKLRRCFNYFMINNLFKRFFYCSSKHSYCMWYHYYFWYSLYLHKVF